MNNNVYGIDLGTCNMKVYCKATNKILNEKNTIALVNKNQRYKLKIVSIILCSIYIFSVFVLKDKYICTLILLALTIQSILINPFTYKIFRLPYANYKVYINDAATLQK